MTEETRESYDSGEVVWVKLGSSWWPGEVKNADELPTEVLDFKKPPLVIVKFFDEDSYEYVKSWVNIYPYNCDKKKEFIKKGMAAFRANVPHMEKFPKDVLKAEEKLGGNVNILSDPMFLPEKKRNYAAEVFGTPSPKSGTPKNKRRSNKSSGKKDTSHITHRRFLGADDYRAYICIQYPGKDRIPGDKEDEEVLRINREPEQDFNCHSCNFTTKRLEVMILHTKSHIKGEYLSSAWKNKLSASRRRKEKSKRKKRGSDTLDSESNSSDSEVVTQKKRKPRTQSAKKKKTKEPPKKDIRSELLEAWEDSEDEDDLDFSFEKMKETLDKIGDGSSSEAVPDSSLKKSDTVDALNETDSALSEIADEIANKPRQADKNVEKSSPQTIEEALNDVAGELSESNLQNELAKPLSEPLSTEKLLSTLEDDSMDFEDEDKVEEKKTDEKAEPILEEKDDGAKEESGDTTDVDDDASKQRMDKDMHEAIKSCFDFDEDDEEDTTIVGKAATGRKIPRVIPKKPAKKSPEQVEAEPDKTLPGKDKGPREDMDAAFKELMELTSVPDLPDVQNTLKCEQNFHNIKTIKFPDKSEGAGSPPKMERKDSTEVATKLTNPKKRFVKSFEDFELMQNEIRRREEEQLEAPRNKRHEDYVDPREAKAEVGGYSVVKSDYSDHSDEQYSPDSTIELSKLKSKIMSKIIEEAKINTESKNKIMAKINEPKAPKIVELPVTADSEAKVSSNSHEKAKTEKVSVSHRTPRSKILESYRKDASKRKVEEKTEPTQAEVSRNEDTSNTDYKLRDSQPDKDVVPPVRKKWSRRGSHPKKDRKLFMLEDTTPETSSRDVPKDKPQEPAITEDQTFFEPEPITDSDKINDIILGSLKRVPPEDVFSTKEVIEEEVVEHVVKESADIESRPTEADKQEVTEELPLTDEAMQKLPVTQEVTEELSSMHEATEELLPAHEVFEELPLAHEVTEELPSAHEVTDDLPLAHEVTEELPLTYDITKELPLRQEVTEELPMTDEVTKELPLTDEVTKELPFTDEVTKELPLTDEVAEELPFTDEVTKELPLTDEVAKELPLTDEVSGELPATDEVTEELLLTNEVTEELPLTAEVTKELPLAEETTEELSLLDEGIEKDTKLSSVEDEVAKSEEVSVSNEPSTDVGEAETAEDLGESVEGASRGLAEEVPPILLETEVPPEAPLVEEEKLPVTEEDSKMSVEQVVDVSESKEISPEEGGEDVTPPKVEDASEVPLTETKTLDNEESALETIETAEHIVEESPVIPPPVTDSRTSPVKDTIAIPPKKSKKRKMSHQDLDLGSTKSDAVSEPLFDDSIPLEKRKKEMDVTEVEVDASSSVLESTDSGDTEKTAVEVAMEAEESAKVPEPNDCDKEVIDESQQIEKVEENKESSSEIIGNANETRELVCKEPGDDVETDKVSIEKEEEKGELEPDKTRPEDKEEEEDKIETDLKSMETETAAEQPKDTECNKEDDPSAKEHVNEVEIQCASSSVDSFKFSIQTNLSILSSREEMSALALATLSEIKADLESNEDVIPKGKGPKKERAAAPPVLLESEMVAIEGNLTVVSEKDLADGQVEITSEQVISPKRPITMSNFSMDFSDSLSDSNSNSTTDTSSDISKCAFNSKGTEFTPKAFTKQMKRVDQKRENKYGRLELINILEGNSDTEKKPKEYTHLPKKSAMVDDICDFEEHIPSQIVCAKSLKPVPMELEPDYKEFKEKSSKTSVKSTASKLLERLTTESKAKASAAKIKVPTDIPALELIGKTAAKSQGTPSSTPKGSKYVLKPKPGSSSSKPIILSEQIVKPATETPKTKTRKTMDDIEDVEAFVIHKDPKKGFEKEEAAKPKSVATKSAGKAKILQQTIITPAGEIIQPGLTETHADDNIFDINSMPIVLSDELLTPESIEKMPIVIGSDSGKAVVPEKVVNRATPNRIITTATTPQTTPNKSITITKHKPPRILQSFGNKVVKNSPLLPNTAKPGKYIIVPQSSIPPTTTTKYTPKKQTIVKKTPVPAATSVVPKMPNIAPEPSGNKIMIVTNQQGQQQRLLLTPAQQKMLGYQNQKVTKTIVKGNVMQKSILAAKTVPLSEANLGGITSKTSSLIGQKILVGMSSNQTLITTTSHQMVMPQGRITKTVTRRSTAGTPKLAVTASKPQKTILIKNQHGQTVRKIQGTDDELLDKQVAEQLEAIKASSGMKFSPQQKLAELGKGAPKTTVRRFYSKRADLKMRGPPPLAGLQQTPKPETVVAMPALKKPEPAEPKLPALPPLEELPKTQQADRPLNQLVIQDALGNQTTITEGQILALPSETVDGQPQSYMLVTLDESGNLTPLNSEALMSLDPNLGLGGDLSNMVLQIDQSALSDRPQQAIIKQPEVTEPIKAAEVECTPQQVPEPSVTTEIAEALPEQKIAPPAAAESPQASTNGDPGQQLIVTGDPIATQKFLESLTEGTTDLANILANAEGNSILIQADGQQILINTNTDNQMLLSMNNDNVNVTESTEGGGNPIFATQPSKNQDILAAALADTDVFQQEHPGGVQSKIGSQLSPSNALYPMNVGSVLETSLTLSSPIMTPLEVPSTNTKKIPDDEADILTQIPKNVDLPITITDPNISQTVANQQVSAMLASELHANLELALPISESAMSASVSTGMNSPSFVYSLPALDDSVEIAQKPFNGSMPLLTEDVEETMSKAKLEEERKKSPSAKGKMGETSSDGFLAEEEEGRFTLGGEMCSSLSEPPPEMFDLPEVGQGFGGKGLITAAAANVPSLQSTPDVSDNASKDEDTTTDLSQADTSSEGSCEIPLQPQIVAKSLELNLDSLKRSLGEASAGSEVESKKCKFD